ncbi:MAG: putative membrane-associated Zn-dependent proteases 1 [uncultured archaeon A07HB70]|nr:MAG: putative membrane-associated Zn-dependent proteases 1 [uncultured archaeon A07HB70]
MDLRDPSADGPPTARLRSLLHLRAIERDGDERRYHGDPLVPRSVLTQELDAAFREAGYECRVVDGRDAGEVTVVAEPTSPGVESVPWTNVALALATVCSTLLVGAVAWYYVPPSAVVQNPLVALRAWPFTAAVLGVLATHELGHYLVGRYHGVDVSLPYLIPFIVPFGTLGAVIRMRGRMPDRRALFDIGVAGPLAGLVATVVVTAVGLWIDPMRIPSRVVSTSGQVIVFNDPPLLRLVAAALGQPTGYADPGLTIHPIIIGGWVGMFFTLLNLLPVGQLDGGHVLRAMLGRRQETVAAVVPGTLFALAGYLYFVEGFGPNESVGLWVFWGLLTTVVAYNGPANPADETPLGWRRIAVGVATFALGALCFVAVPVELLG